MVKEKERDTSRFTAGKGIEALSITLRPQETALYVFYEIESDKIRNRVANVCKVALAVPMKRELKVICVLERGAGL